MEDEKTNMLEKVECKEKGCKGTVNKSRTISLMTGCGGPSFSLACPCDSCGRLYWYNDNSSVFNRPGDKAFLKNGKVVHVKKNGEEYSLY